MGRQPKKMPGENGADKLLSEKIMGKFPKVKCNKENLDFDEDDIDGINILSFTTFEQLKVRLFKAGFYFISQSLNQMSKL